MRVENNIVKRTTFKERGSLVAMLNQSQYGRRDRDRDEFVIPSQTRNRNTPQNPRKANNNKKLAHASKRVKVDVFIPTMISVANLARLLKVKLG